MSLPNLPITIALGRASLRDTRARCAGYTPRLAPLRVSPASLRVRGVRNEECLHGLA